MISTTAAATLCALALSAAGIALNMDRTSIACSCGACFITKSAIHASVAGRERNGM